ncbi:MAG: hypothetical protein K1X83_07685 [Oligoflexia bacterium]|nr:hypothetical protein [Oligoflexia bacterium]
MKTHWSAAKIVTLALIVGVLALAGLGCSKSNTGSSAGGAAGLIDADIVKLVPADTVGFLVWDTASDAYDRYRKSAWAGSGDNTFVGMLEKKMGSNDTSALNALLKAMRTAGLIPSTKDEKPQVERGVLFASMSAEKKKAGLGCYAFTNAKDLGAKISALESVLKSENIDVKRGKVAGRDGLIATLPVPVDDSFKLNTLYIVGADGKLGAATDEAAIEGLFAAPAAGAPASGLLVSPRLQRIRAAAQADNSQFGVGFLDLTALFKIAPQLAPSGPDTPKVDQIPVESVYFSQSMDESPHSVLLVATAPKSEEQQRWFGGLEGKGLGDSAAGAPGGTAALIGLDGRLLASIKSAALSEISPQEQAAFKDQLALLDQIQSFSLALVNASPSSPFPGLALSFEASNPTALFDTVKQQLGGALASSGLPLGTWSDKEIDGVKISFIQSPMVGLGVFMGVAKNRLLITSSEEGATDLIGAVKDNKKSLAAQVPAKSKELLSENKPILAAYGNFDKIAATIESVQGNLAAFTGGASGLDQEAINNMRKMGSFALGMNFQQGIFKIQSSYDKLKE